MRKRIPPTIRAAVMPKSQGWSIAWSIMALLMREIPSSEKAKTVRAVLAPGRTRCGGRKRSRYFCELSILGVGDGFVWKGFVTMEEVRMVKGEGAGCCRARKVDVTMVVA